MNIRYLAIGLFFYQTPNLLFVTPLFGMENDASGRNVPGAVNTFLGTELKKKMLVIEMNEKQLDRRLKKIGASRADMLSNGAISNEQIQKAQSTKNDVNNGRALLLADLGYLNQYHIVADARLQELLNLHNFGFFLNRVRAFGPDHQSVTARLAIIVVECGLDSEVVKMIEQLYLQNRCKSYFDLAVKDLRTAQS